MMKNCKTLESWKNSKLLKISLCGNVRKHFMILIIVHTPLGTFPLQSTEIERHDLNFGLF